MPHDAGVPLAPDFERLRRVLMLEGEPDRVPNAELHVDWQIKQAFLERPIRTVQDDVDFWYRAGYDYIYLRANYEYRMVGDGHADEDRIYAGDMQLSRWAGDEISLVSNWQEFEAYPWPDAATIDYENLVECARCLAPGMKIISGVGGIFTRVWRIMGFEPFCFALMDRPDLVEAMFRRVGQIQLEVFRRIVEMEHIGAMWYGDDLAYISGTMVHPQVLRRWLFPYLSEMGRLCRARDLPFVIHSDGNLWQVLPDLIACGFNAIHPVEPKSMDSRELKAAYGHQLCLLGNIEIGETLTLGTPQDVEAEVRQRIRALAPGGGYAVGSSNTVAHYVKLENFKAMIRATRRYGRYPLDC
ncbi:MAG: uroporphyrinogen decarboxylase family protein [Chloroflexota bacterium]